MKIAIAKSDVPNTSPLAFKTLDGAIDHYRSEGFGIVAYLNTQPDLTPGGVKMAIDLNSPVFAPEEVTIVMVDVIEK